MPDMSEQAIRRRYQALEDLEIAELAVYEVSNLSETAQRILREEVERRGLLPREQYRIVSEAQTRGLGPEELSALVERVRDLPCPLCDSSDTRLNACEVAVPAEIGIEARTILGCPNCIGTYAEKARRGVASKRWWMFLLNPFPLLKALDINTAAIMDSDEEGPNPALEEFVRENVGAVTLMLEEERE